MRRRGITILELTMALLLAGVALAGIGRLLSVVAAQQRESERRVAAVCEAGNQMERLAVLPWDELTAETVADWRLSPEAAAALPGGTLAVQIADVEASPEGAPAARRVEVRVGWRNSAGRDVNPIRLVAWRYDEGTAP